MLLRTINRNGNIVLKNHQQKDAKNIIYEKNGYVIKLMNYYGEDYGREYNYNGECDISYEEIIPERILVKNNHFAGISVQGEYDYYNGNSVYEMKDSILFVDDTGCIKIGYDYSFDDHSRWNYICYYLITREQMEKERESEYATAT